MLVGSQTVYAAVSLQLQGIDWWMNVSQCTGLSTFSLNTDLYMMKLNQNSAERHTKMVHFVEKLRKSIATGVTLRIVCACSLDHKYPTHGGIGVQTSG